MWWLRWSCSRSSLARWIAEYIFAQRVQSSTMQHWLVNSAESHTNRVGTTNLRRVARKEDLHQSRSPRVWNPTLVWSIYNYLPVVPHKAVAEVSNIGNLRGWLLWIRDVRAKPLMDRKVLEVSSLSLSFSDFIYLSISLSISDLSTYLPTFYLSIYLSVCLSIYLSIYLSSIYLSIYLSTYLPTYLSIYAVYLSIYLSSCLPVYLVYLCIYLSICLPVYAVVQCHSV